MRRPVHDSFRMVLAVVLATLLALQPLPMRAVADELDEGIAAFARLLADCQSLTAAADDAEGESASADEGAPIVEVEAEGAGDKVSAPQEKADEAAPIVEVVAPGLEIAEEAEPEDGLAAFAAGRLEGSAIADDGSTYDVVVSFGKAARVPEGAALVLSVFDGDPADKELRARTEKAFDLSEDDRLLDTRYVDAWIEMEGERVVPAAVLDVTITCDAFAVGRSAFVEIASLENGEEVTALAGESDEDVADPKNEPSLPKDDHTTAISADADAYEGAMTRSLKTRDLGTFAVACVAKRQCVFEDKGIEVALLMPRACGAPHLVNAAAPDLEEGVDLLDCIGVEMEPAGADETLVLVEATGGDDIVCADDLAGGVFGYLVDGTGVLDNEPIFGPEGTAEAVPFDVATDRLLLVWDSGYRNATLKLGAVTVAGMMPAGTEGEALDVSESYGEDSTAIPSLEEGIAVQEEMGTSKLTTLAAFDISLTAAGDEYQPDEDHPLTVTIEDDQLMEGLDVEVLHVTDAGATERITDFELGDGCITFTATGFSRYLVVQADDDETEVGGRSETFFLRAYAKGYTRRGTVRFVDDEKNPIMGTVTGEKEIRYTGSGKESNETNTIDMYSFIDRLSPDILDEYDFSRVFVQLTATDEKDFRYVQVGDGTAIGQDASILRAYFHLNSIDENASGKDYYGTWYNVAMGGRMDDIYIEYYHVAPASFKTIDTRNDPVEGAEFALYTDPDCYAPFEYKHEEMKAVSDRNGIVSFGKIPRGTYYMKETVIPEGYKKSTNIYEVIVDGETPIADVVHEDDDGSIIIADVLRMKLTKEWEDDAALHTRDSVEVTVYAHGKVVDVVELNADNHWTQTLEDLDPNEPYMVSETCVSSNGSVVTNNWIPEITYDELDPHVEYYKAEDFKKGKQYVILTRTQNGTRALVGATTLTTVPLEANDIQITGEVTDAMLWDVDTITKDGILALKNVASGSYLDQGSRWYLNASYPVPLYVRHINNDGVIKFYHRANLNSANAYYLYIWYARGGKAEGTVDRYMNNESQGAAFNLYRKVNVRSVDVTISNKTTRYPIAIRNVAYPKNDPMPDVTFDLFDEQDYEEGKGTPLMRSLTAGPDGYLADEKGKVLHELSAGIYYLCRTSDLTEEGYAPLAPIKFTITRGGALKVAQEDQEISGFAYSTMGTVEDVSCPILQVPNHKGATVEVTLKIAGPYADMTREFGFELTMPEGVSEIEASVDGERMTLTSENNTFVLAHGQTVVLEEVPSTVSYVLTQTSDRVAARPAEGDGLYVATVEVGSEAGTVTATQRADDARVLTLSGLVGRKDDPARVTITNTLPSFNAPPTGVADNTSTWVAIMVVCLFLMALVWQGNRTRRAC